MKNMQVDIYPARVEIVYNDDGSLKGASYTMMQVTKNDDGSEFSRMAVGPQNLTGESTPPFTSVIDQTLLNALAQITILENTIAQLQNELENSTVQGEDAQRNMDTSSTSLIADPTKTE